MNTLEFIIAIVGTTAFNQLITFLVSRRKNQLDEAKMISDISAKLREELFQKYEERGRQISLLRRAILKLTDFLDRLLPRISTITERERDKLKELVLDTRLVALSAEM